MAKPNLQNIPDQKRKGTQKSAGKKSLVMVVSLISSMVAAVVVGLLIINSSWFKSFRSDLTGIDMDANVKSKSELSNEPVELDENYDYEADKRSPRNKSGNSNKKPATKTEKSEPKPAWKDQAALRNFPVVLIEPKSETEQIEQIVMLAISQRNYDLASELHAALKKNPENAAALAFSDLESRIGSLGKFWRTVQTGLGRCTIGTEIKLNGQYVKCVTKRPGSITFSQTNGAEKSFTTHLDQIRPELAAGFHHLVKPDDTKSTDLFLELDFVGDKRLLAAQVESKRAATPKTASTDNPKPKKNPVKTTPTIAVVQEPATPIPDKEQLREMVKQIRQLFPEQYANRSDNGKRNLADLLLKQGLETKDDPVARYALLSESLELAQKIGEGRTAWAATDEIVEAYEVDEFQFRCDVLRELGKTLEDPEEFSALTGHCQKLIDQEVALDQYETAVAKSRKLLAVAKKGANESTIDFLDDSVKRIRKLATAYTAIEDQIAIVKKQPDNQVANQATGEFYCFVKNDFPTGLAYLAKGNLEPTQTIAAKEIQSEGNLEIADAWWDLAETMPKESAAIKAHAAEIYSEIESTLNGLTQKRVQARLEEIQVAAHKNKARDPIFQSDWRIAWKVQAPWDTRFNQDGTVNLLTKNELKTFQWRFIDEGIFVQTSKSRHYIFVRDDKGQIIAQAFNSKTSKQLDSVIATRLEQGSLKFE